MTFGGGAGADLGSARGEIIISTAAAEKSVKQLSGAVNTFGDTSANAFQRMATGLGLLAVSKGVLSVFGGMVGTAAVSGACTTAVPPRFRT